MTERAPLGLAGRRVVVLGLGLFGGGLGAARWALARGAHVTVTDLRDRATLASSLTALESFAASLDGGADRLRVVLGRHEDRDFATADLVICNPAVPPGARPLGVAVAAGATVTTATALLMESAPCRFAAITGTNGKSSTTHFLSELLRQTETGRVVHAGGNIGGSLLDVIDTLTADDLVVLELSSYQLEHMPAAAPRVFDVAIITNIGVDHLERHGTVERYRAAKLRILDHVRRGGTTLLPQAIDDLADGTLRSAGVTRLVHGTRPRSASVGVADDGRFMSGATVLGHVEHLAVRGAFQAENAALALAAAHALGADAGRCAQAVRALGGLRHRLESLGLHGREGSAFDVFDNGVSTAPESTISAMRCLVPHRSGSSSDPSSRSSSGPVLLAGGKAKAGQSFGALAEEAVRGGWRVAPFGAAAAEIAGAVLAAGGSVLSRDGRSPLPGAPMEPLIETIAGQIGPGGLLLFSPACASFDAYPNFSARAEAFQRALSSAVGAPDLPRSSERIQSQD